MEKSEKKVVISERPKIVSLPPPLKPLKQDPKPKVALPKITLQSRSVNPQIREFEQKQFNIGSVGINQIINLSDYNIIPKQPKIAEPPKKIFHEQNKTSMDEIKARALRELSGFKSGKNSIKSLTPPKGVDKKSTIPKISNVQSQNTLESIVIEASEIITTTPMKIVPKDFVTDSTKTTPEKQKQILVDNFMEVTPKTKLAKTESDCLKSESENCESSQQENQIEENDDLGKIQIQSVSSLSKEKFEESIQIKEEPLDSILESNNCDNTKKRRISESSIASSLSSDSLPSPKKQKLNDCQINLSPGLTFDSGEKSVKIIKANLPRNLLSEFEYDLLDAQFSVQLPKIQKIVRPRLVTTTKAEEVYGFSNGSWVTSQTEYDQDVSMTIEGSDGTVNESWCQMTK